MFPHFPLMTGTTFLTKQGYEKLVEELRLLKDEKLPAVLERLKEAISQGDISENAEYDTAMSEKELIEGRISEISASLDHVEIIEHKQDGEIRYGSKVSFIDDKDREYTYTIVGTGEVDILAGNISFQSPLGIALRGKKKGDVVQVKAPNKKYSVKVTNVR